MKPPKLSAFNARSLGGGSRVVNQVEVETPDGRYFCSYGKTIAFIPLFPTPPAYAGGPAVRAYLCENWSPSQTTSKYRCQFLDERGKETEKKLKRGEYEIADLQ